MPTAGQGGTRPTMSTLGLRSQKPGPQNSPCMVGERRVDAKCRGLSQDSGGRGDQGNTGNRGDSGR
jgi:hypothetical protein